MRDGKPTSVAVSWRGVFLVLLLGAAGGALLPSHWEWGLKQVISIILLATSLGLAVHCLVRFARALIATYR